MVRRDPYKVVGSLVLFVSMVVLGVTRIGVIGVVIAVVAPITCFLALIAWVQLSDARRNRDEDVGWLLALPTSQVQHDGYPMMGRLHGDGDQLLWRSSPKERSRPPAMWSLPTSEVVEIEIRRSWPTSRLLVRDSSGDEVELRAGLRAKEVAQRLDRYRRHLGQQWTVLWDGP